jgi:hypothetical protein
MATEPRKTAEEATEPTTEAKPQSKTAKILADDPSAEVKTESQSGPAQGQAFVDPSMVTGEQKSE